jgi:hypothetical protein
VSAVPMENMVWRSICRPMLPIYSSVKHWLDLTASRT